MIKVYRLLVFTPLLLFSISCRKGESVVADSQTSSEPLASIVLEGPLKNPDLLVDGVSIFDPVPLTGAESEQEVADKVYEFVRDSFYVWNAPQGKKLGTYLYGYGYSLCHMQSKVLAALWHQRGVSGRIVSWPKHTMAEAKVDGQWLLYDPQHRVHYTRLLERPVSFQSLQENLDIIKDIDPVGYGGEYWRDLIRRAEVDKDPVRKALPKPNLSLTSGQRLVIEPRVTESPFALPSSPAPDTQPRSHLIPLYEVTLHHEFQSSKAKFLTGLPILGISGNRDREISVTVSGGESRKGTVGEISNFVHGETRKIQIQAPVGSQLSITYALAAWCGDRVFKKDKESYELTLRSDDGGGGLQVKPKLASPSIHLSSLVQSKEDPFLFHTLLSWRHFDKGSEYQIFVDELSSSFPLEAWRHLDQRLWTWNEEADPPEGSALLQFRWQPGAGGPYRPEKYRTLLLSARGPGLASGSIRKTTHFLDPAIGQDAPSQ